MKLFTIAEDVVGPHIGKIDDETLAAVIETLRAVIA